MASLSTLKLMSFVSNKNIKVVDSDQSSSPKDRYSVLSACNNVMAFSKTIQQVLKGLCILSILANDRYRKLQYGDGIVEERVEGIMEENEREEIMREGEIISQYYSYEALDQEDCSIGYCSKFNQYISLLVKNFLIDDNRVISCMDYSSYPSLFECCFSFFTALKEKSTSLNQQFIRNVDQMIDFLKQVNGEYRRCYVRNDAKRLKLASIDSKGFEFVESLVNQFKELLDKQQTSEGTENPLDSQLEFESLKTKLLEAISTQCSSHYILFQNMTFDPEYVEAKMDASFSQLVRFIHFTIPPEDTNLNLMDRYYLSVISGIRVFYVHAIQQACMVILLNQAKNWDRRLHRLY